MAGAFEWDSASDRLFQCGFRMMAVAQQIHSCAVLLDGAAEWTAMVAQFFRKRSQPCTFCGFQNHMDSAELGKRLQCFYEFCIFIHHSGLPHPSLCGYAGLENSGRIRNIADGVFIKTGMEIFDFSFFCIKYSFFCIVSRSFLLYNYQSWKRGKGEMAKKRRNDDAKTSAV